MSRVWIGRIALLIFQFLLPPVGLLGLLPNIEDLGQVFKALPSLTLVVYVLAWIVDYGLAFVSIGKWTKEGT